MSRTLEPGISLLSAAEMRVVVVPIGPMPRDTFEGYLEALNVHRHVPLNATASFHQSGTKTPFPHLPYKTGAMHFRFMQAEDARRRSRVSDLHVQRNVIAVLGLLHCPLVEDITTAHSEFQRAIRQWPEALVAQCAAFEPSPAHLAAPTAKLHDLMIFPAGHLDQHLEVYMHEFAAAVLSAIEDHLLNATVSTVKLNTYVDSGDFLGSLVQIEEGLRKLNINEEEVKEKKRWGRLQKSKGDWSLLVGSPKDAFEHYKSAMELSRAAGDAIWYGAAVEGLAHARVLEALLSARLAAAGGRSVGARSSMSSSPAVTPTKAAAAAAGLDIAGGAAGGADADRAAAAAAAVDGSTTPRPSGMLSPGLGSSLIIDSTSAEAAAEDEQPQTAAATAGAEQQQTAAAAAGAAAGTAAEAAGGGSEGVQQAGSPTPSPFAAQSEGQPDTPFGTNEQPAAAAAAAAAAAEQPAEHGTASTPADAASSNSSTAAGRAASLPAMPPPPSPTAAAATAAAAAQLARRRSIGSAAAAAAAAAAVGPLNYSLSGQGFCVMLASADLEGEVRELLSEAKAWYRKKGGALPLQIEQSVKLCRFLACTAAGTAATAARSSGSAAAAAAPEVLALKTQLQGEVNAAVSFILDNLAGLSLMEDRALALAEAAQLLGLAGCGRKRLLLLWAALDVVCTGGSGPAAAAGAGGGLSVGGPVELGPGGPGAAVDVWGLLRLCLTAMEPPDQPGQQDPDDVARVHWSLKRFIAWQQQHMQAAAAAAPGKQQQGINTASSAPQQQQQQQQQFQQLLGPQLQLLTQAQAAALEAPCLLQPRFIKQTMMKRPASPSKLSIAGAAAAFPGQESGSMGTPQQQVPQQAGAVLPIGVLAELLNPNNQQQWMPGGGCLWDVLQVALLEMLVNAARVANAPVDAWEAAATLLRDYYPLLPQALQSSLMETLSTCGAALGTRLRSRPGPGPGPQVQLKRVVPGPACLQPQSFAAPLCPDNSSSSSSIGGSSLKRAEGAAGSGPFIFDPYAAKRKVASAAAAAQAALPEWVCGEEGRVEVVLVNPCATPLRLDGLQLQVQPHQPSITAPVGAESGGSHAPAQQQQQQQRSVSVMLAAGSKPVKVVLSYVPSRPGLMAITGVQAMAKGVSWYQPFVQLLPVGSTSSGGAAAVAAAAVAAAGGGRDPAKPLGCFTVQVQPHLPLIKASLQGPEVQLTHPADEDLTGLTQPNSSSSSGPATPGNSSSSWQAPAMYTSSPAAAAAVGGSGVGGGPDLEKKATTVVVFEGQTLTWNLTVTNRSSQPITGCKVTVLNAKGTVLKPPAAVSAAAAVGQQQQQQQALLHPPGLTGAYLEVLDQGLRAVLPLSPGASASLPVTVVVGKPPGSMYDASTVQICIHYHSTATTPGNNTDTNVLGRSLTLPIRLAIQPTLQVKSMRFLQQGMPLRNGSRDDTVLKQSQKLLLQSLRASRDPTSSLTASSGGYGLASAEHPAPGFAGSVGGAAGGGGAGGGVIRRGPSHHVRNSSEGSVPVGGITVGPVMPLHQGGPFVDAAAAGGAAAAAGSACDGGSGAYGKPLSSIPSDVSMTGAFGEVGAGPAAAGGQQQQQAGYGGAHSPTKHHGGSARQGSAAAAAAAGGTLALSSQPVLELVVRNASERYFRTWLGCLPDRLSVDKALSAVAVLEPGDTEKLAAVVPTPALDAPGSIAAAAAAAAAAGGGGGGAVSNGVGSGPAAAAAAAAAGQSAGGTTTSGDLREPPRLAAAEVLVGRLVVCWEMITGAAAAGVLPHGWVPLEPLDVAANLTPVALSALCPSPLHLRLSIPPAASAPPSQAPSHMVDLSALLASSSTAAAAASGGGGGPRGSTGGSNARGSSGGSSAQPGQQRGSTAGVGLAGSGVHVPAGVGWSLPGVTGPLWGLHVRVGQYLAVDLEVSYAAAAAAAAAAAGAAAPAEGQQQQQQLELQVALFALDALNGCHPTQQPGTPTVGTPKAAAAAQDKAGGSSTIAALLSGQSLGPKGFAAAAAVRFGGSATPKAAEAALRSTSSATAGVSSAGEGLVDPGVLLTGCYNKLQVTVAAGGKHTCRMHALLVQPGLYVFGVADVQLVQASDVVDMGGGAAAAAARGGPAGVRFAPDSSSGRVYYNHDRLYALVTR